MDLAALDRPHVAPLDHRLVSQPEPSATPLRFPERIASRPSLAAGRRRGLIELVGLTAVIALLFGQVMGVGGNLAFWQDATPAPPPADSTSGLSRVGAGRTGSYADAGPTGVPTLRWIAENDSAPGVFLQPTAADGVLYVADYFDGDISKVTADGSIVGSVTRSTVIAYLVDAGTVFVASGEGDSATLGAYGDGDGTELWSVRAGQSAAELGYDGERLFLVDMDGILHAFDVEDGNESWTVDLEVENQDTIFQPPYSVFNDATPAVSDGLVVVGTGAGDVRAFSVKDGTPTWSFVTPMEVVGSPTIIDGTVYVASRELTQSGAPGLGRVHALSLSTGEERWAFDQPAWTEGPSKASGVLPVDVLVLTTDGERVYVNGDGSVGEIVTALDAETGSVVWSASFGVTAGAAPVIAGNTLHLTRPDGGVYGLNAETGEQRWRLDAGTADLQSPVIVDDLLLLSLIHI